MRHIRCPGRGFSHSSVQRITEFLVNLIGHRSECVIAGIDLVVGLIDHRGEAGVGGFLSYRIKSQICLVGYLGGSICGGGFRDFLLGPYGCVRYSQRG